MVKSEKRKVKNEERKVNVKSEKSGYLKVLFYLLFSLIILHLSLFTKFQVVIKKR